MGIVYGDLLELAKQGKFDVIVHGCNCFNTMSSGIAKQIKEQFPNAYLTDQRTIKGDKSKLGTITWARHDDLIIINAYTQYSIGKGKQVSYDAIAKCFTEIADKFGDKKIGYPLIGAGLGGGDWDIISKIIEKTLDGCEHDVVVYQS